MVASPRLASRRPLPSVAKQARGLKFCITEIEWRSKQHVDVKSGEQ
jgi:hypothetical protein